MSEDDKKLRKQWTAVEIITLIEAFRKHTNLWDPDDADYKNRIKKMESYKEIAQIFDGINWQEIERKIRNVTSQYQRERRNYRQSKRIGTSQSFRAKWFGYDAMSFMHDRKKKVQIDGDKECESSDEDTQTEPQHFLDIKSEVEDEDVKLELVEELNSTIPAQTERISADVATRNSSQSLHFQNQPTSPIIKTNTNMEGVGETTQVLPRYEKNDRDEYDLFGEMVAYNIRSLKSEYSRITVQQQIANLLFDARKLQFSRSNL